MTQPIQEPSQDRSMQGANWGVRQLFRRPAQALDLTSVWAYIAYIDGFSVPTGDWWQPQDDAEEWTEAYTSADASGLIIPDLATGELVCANGSDPDHFLWRAHAIASWQDTSPAAGTWLGLRISPLSTGSPVANPTSEGWAPADMAITEGAIGAVTHDSYHAATATDITFTTTVFQDSGGDLFLNFLILYVVRDEVFDTSGGTFYPT